MCVFRDGSSGLLVVDNGPAITQQSVEIRQRSKRNMENSSDSGLFVGGMPTSLMSALTKYKHGIHGCVADLVINTDYHLQLINHSDMGHNISECEV